MSITLICPDIETDSPLWDEMSDAEALAERAIEAASRWFDGKLFNGAEVSILLSDNNHVREVNHEWRALDKPTNVLSFPAVEPDKINKAAFLGDIILAYETIAEEAKTEGKSFADHYTHLVIHGFLHLLGYDHDTEEKAELMENLEIAILADLNIPNPYSDQPIRL